MSNVNHILSKLSAIRKTQNKISANKVNLGKVDDMIEQLNVLSDEVRSLSAQISENVSMALSDANQLQNIQGQVEQLYQDALQTQVDIEDLGLDVPPELNDATEEAQSIIDADVIVLVNALEEAERVIFNG